jgi:hypothetical protein
MTTLIKTIIISTAAFLLSCNHASTTTIAADLTTKNEIKDGDTLSKTADTIVVKDGLSNDTLVKFKPHSFTDYAVDTIEIKFDKKLDFSDYEYKKMYRTATKEDVKENGVNFAGHFCFAYWGCGSPCKVSAVVDLRTGKVYNGLPSGIGYSFKKDSRLLIVNPPDSTNWYDITVPYAIPEEYEWTGKEFIRIKTSS